MQSPLVDPRSQRGDDGHYGTPPQQQLALKNAGSRRPDNVVSRPWRIAISLVVADE